MSEFRLKLLQIISEHKEEVLAEYIKESLDIFDKAEINMENVLRIKYGGKNDKSE